MTQFFVFTLDGKTGRKVQRRFLLVCKVIFSCALIQTAQVACLDNAGNACRLIAVGKVNVLRVEHTQRQLLMQEFQIF